MSAVVSPRRCDTTGIRRERRCGGAWLSTVARAQQTNMSFFVASVGKETARTLAVLRVPTPIAWPLPGPQVRQEPIGARI